MAGILGRGLWSLIPGAVTDWALSSFCSFSETYHEWLEIARIGGLSTAYLSNSRTFGLSRLVISLHFAQLVSICFFAPGRREYDAPACFDQTSRCEFSDSEAGGMAAAT